MQADILKTNLFESHSVRLISWLFAIAFVMEAAYIERTFSIAKWIEYGSLCFALLLSIGMHFKRRTPISIELIILFSIAAYLSLLTMANDGPLQLIARDMLPIVAICLFVSSLKSEELPSVLSLWCVPLCVLLMIDIATMLAFPDGMYSTDTIYASYTANWFLGYKTDRLSTVFPLLVFLSFIQLRKFGQIKPLFYFASALVVLDTVLSDGSAALSGVIFFIVCTALLGIKGFFFSPSLNKLLDYRIFLTIYILVVVGIVVMQNSPIMETMSGFFSKSTSLSGRTPLWHTTMQSISDSFVLGKGLLGSEDYIFITGGFLNAHNQLLEIVTEGGLVALCLNIALMIVAFRQASRNSGSIVFLYGLYSLLLVGITSAKLAYDPMFFCLLFLIGRCQESGFHIRKSHV
ncbi:O-antigen ligase family protein [Eggerthella sinensis]|uniref:O-antigen ligase family protein n=1 Tax=Eggerthella sinensis TaxID=242230 RepID=UPI0022E42D85|nr:O-antigen ligase family protein [Eggerthella sinensis]